MSRDCLRDWRQGAGHLGWEDLLLHLDGELPEAESRRAAEHLHSCWQCRTEAEKITEAITRFVVFRNAGARRRPHRIIGADSMAGCAGWLLNLLQRQTFGVSCFAFRTAFISAP